MPNLDRFSRPLLNEGKLSQADHLNHISEQNEENKHDLVQSFIWNTWDETQTFPDAETIVNHFYKVDLDYDHVAAIIQNVKGMTN